MELLTIITSSVLDDVGGFKVSVEVFGWAPMERRGDRISAAGGVVVAVSSGLG